MYEAHFRTVVAAKSLFQGQYLIYRIQVSEKIAMELRCIFSKFYLIVLDYVLYIIDRLNAVSKATIQLFTVYMLIAPSRQLHVKVTIETLEQGVKYVQS